MLNINLLNHKIIKSEIKYKIKFNINFHYVEINYLIWLLLLF